MQKIWEQNKNLIIIAGIIIVILAIGIGAYVAHKQNNSSTNSTANGSPQINNQANVPTLKPSDIGMSLAVTRNGESVTMTATKLTDISAFDYEVTYTAVNNGNSIPRGVIGHIDVKPGQNQVSQEVVLGTCSDVCHYDTGVTNVAFAVKVTKTNGQVYQVNDSIDVQ